MANTNNNTTAADKYEMTVNDVNLAQGMIQILQRNGAIFYVTIPGTNYGWMGHPFILKGTEYQRTLAAMLSYARTRNMPIAIELSGTVNTSTKKTWRAMVDLRDAAAVMEKRGIELYSTTPKEGMTVSDWPKKNSPKA